MTGVDRAADGERHVDARFAEVERGSRRQKRQSFDNQHPFPEKGAGLR